jgi:PAS domain S-box-containing protein
MADVSSADQEFARGIALRALHLLDTPAEERFDRIARTASRLFAVPIALVNLVDTDRLWFKSCIGLPTTEADRSYSFCDYTVRQDEPFIIPDTLADPRFADNPLVVEEPHIRFYAGKALRATTGERLGTLCVMDRQPRTFEARDLQALHDLAIWAESELNTIQLSQALAIKQESEERVRAITETALDGIITVDEAGRIWTANPAEETLSGYRASELVGKHFSVLLAEDAEHAIPRDARTLQALGETQDVVGHVQELLGRRSDGTVYPIEVAVSEMRLPDQRFFVCVTRDITERKQAEAGLRLRDRAMAEARNGILITDARAADSPIVYGNPAFEEMTGYRAEEVMGRNCRFLQGPGTDAAAVAAIRRAIEQERGCLVTLVNYRKDGTPFWQELSIAPMRAADGQLTHFIGIQADVTERITAQEVIRQERERADRLLLNILPHEIAERLKVDTSVIADGFSEVSVLFADIVGFTTWASRTAPATVVAVLDEIFSAFDQLTEHHGLEKIKMIGDGYMAVAGMPVPRADHAEIAAALALDLQTVIREFRAGAQAFQLRIGIASGPVVAGVIGRRKFAYDLWGDTVNVASRMESSGVPGAVQVAEATYERLKDRYAFERRGEIEVKGRGRTPTYILVGARTA